MARNQAPLVYGAVRMQDQLLIGDACEMLRSLPSRSVHCCVTSPPYWAQRDYGVEGQIGLEDTPELFVASLLRVLREVHRVLRDDGCLWLNLGDSYFAASPTNGVALRKTKAHPSLKVKDLTGIPWRVAFALQEAGWYLRSDIIWAKDQVMPESVRDRPTRAHEYLFLLTKSPNYFYDAQAVREPFQAKRLKSTSIDKEFGRNCRTVWRINPTHYKGAHLAVFPEEIPDKCIKAGTSAKGACPQCGAPWTRVLERTTAKAIENDKERDSKWTNTEKLASGKRILGSVKARIQAGEDPLIPFRPPTTTGWEPSCECGDPLTVPCVVLDPFAGSGTTLAVAKALMRTYIGVELNPEFGPLIQERLRGPTENAAERSAFDLAMELGDE